MSAAAGAVARILTTPPSVCLQWLTGSPCDHCDAESLGNRSLVIALHHAIDPIMPCPSLLPRRLIRLCVWHACVCRCLGSHLSFSLYSLQFDYSLLCIKECYISMYVTYQWLYRARASLPLPPVVACVRSTEQFVSHLHHLSTSLRRERPSLIADPL